ncbi:hypothetical protein CROQUDRAFT_49455 [Cronartium quercuum f. sp. fusiforme G11]|uniref:Uncharacterized protein n=1 Tax=Cronartium quercuum f. sp. fusiforme G11 TaxID=708437 RepID=A0A9P6NF48_9BASI|nr:hypothetical protein CROQUDRAFT_49455 [Cronartium quercuum f. sp. fusiforme G11]
MDADRQTFASRLRLRDITQPITKSAREYFFHGSDHQTPSISVQPARCLDRRFRGEPPSVVNYSPNYSPNDLPPLCPGGMAGHPGGQIPFFAHAGLHHSHSPHHPQEGGSTRPMFSEYVTEPETPPHSTTFHHQDHGWNQQPSHYHINMAPESPPPFSPPYSASSSPTSVYHHLASIRNHQYQSSLSSFVHPPTSPAVPPISDPFSSSFNPHFRSNPQFAPRTPSVRSPVFNCPESPVFPPGCPPTTPDHFHSSFNQQLAQYHHIQCSPHSIPQSPSASVPRSFLAAQHQQRPPVAPFDLQPPPVFNLNPVKRPLNASSTSSSGNSHQTLFATAASKHPKPIWIERQGLFDHLQPYLYSSDPFNLENSPELNHPHALVFPTAKQEPDPDFRRFPKGQFIFYSA